MRLKLMFLPVVLSRQGPSEDIFISPSLCQGEVRRGYGTRFCIMVLQRAVASPMMPGDTLDQARAVGARVATIAI